MSSESDAPEDGSGKQVTEADAVSEDGNRYRTLWASKTGEVSDRSR